MAGRRNTTRYTLRKGRRIVYRGITNNPRRRAGEHKRAGRAGKMRTEGSKVTRKSGLAWERKHRKSR